MTVYKVSSSPSDDAIDIHTALNKANDGDTIELIKDFFLDEDDTLVIDKNINIIGNLEEDAETIYYPTLRCPIKIDKSRIVNFKNIYLTLNQEDNNVLLLMTQAVARLDNCVLRNEIQDKKVYPLIYANTGSKLIIENTEIPKGNSHQSYQCFAKQANIQIANSQIGAGIWLNNSESKIDNTQIKFDNIALMIQKSSNVEITNSVISGGNDSKIGACVWCVDSNVNFSNTEIKRSNSQARFWVKNSDAELKNIKAESAVFYDNSDVNLDVATFENYLSINSSKVRGDEVVILGNDLKKVGLNLVKSSLQLNTLEFVHELKKYMNIDSADLGFNVKNIKYDSSDDIIPFGDAVDKFQKVASAEKRFDSLFEIDAIKKQILQLVSEQSNDFNVAFLGNSGVGKTTVAKIYTEILSEKGIIQDNYFNKVSAINLSQDQLYKFIEEANRGVLYIDRANELSSEEVNILAQFMQNNSVKPVFILAGPKIKMQKLFKQIKINNKVVFKDYSLTKLKEFGLLQLKNINLTVDKVQYKRLVENNYRFTHDLKNIAWIQDLNYKLTEQLDNKDAITINEIDSIWLYPF